LAELHLITGEYPPRVGGVGDYTRVVAEGLAAAGERVHVWHPREDESAGAGGESEAGVAVRAEFGSFSPAGLARLGRRLDGFAAPRRLLVQYVPHAYGWRSMNVAFCAWLWWRATAKGDRVEVMVHEPCVEFAGSLKQKGAAVVHRLMAATLLRAARRVFVSIPAWEGYWRPYAFGRRVSFEWLPAPSTVPVVGDAAGAARVRARLGLAPGELLVGHFGTYSPLVTKELRRVLPALLDGGAPARVLLMGRGGEPFCEELEHTHPNLRGRVCATGCLGAEELSAGLAACDLLAQPFPDGVTTRRTSVMAALAHGRAVVTTRGRLTEELWRESGAVALAEAGDREAFCSEAARLLKDAGARERLGANARALYRERFDASHTVAALRRETPAEVVTAGERVALAE
jgi:glycosyltransferase involved in cell wall biosynthesis